MSPGRRTNRKNLRSCQRTILLYSFYFWSQRKIRVCKYTCFQASAGRPQARDRKWCSPKIKSREKPYLTRVSAEIIPVNESSERVASVQRPCENRANTASGKELREGGVYGFSSRQDCLSFAVRFRRSCGSSGRTRNRCFAGWLEASS